MTKPSSIGNLPVWAQTVAWIGVPSLIALLLVWFLVKNVSADLGTVKAQHYPMTMYLYQICANTAQVREDREACDRIKPEP